MNDLWFVTFCDPRLTQARKRIRRQVEKMGVFDSCIRILPGTDLGRRFASRAYELLRHECWRCYV